MWVLYGTFELKLAHDYPLLSSIAIASSISASSRVGATKPLKASRTSPESTIA